MPSSIPVPPAANSIMKNFRREHGHRLHRVTLCGHPAHRQFVVITAGMTPKSAHHRGEIKYICNSCEGYARCDIITDQVTLALSRKLKADLDKAIEDAFHADLVKKEENAARKARLAAEEKRVKEAERVRQREEKRKAEEEKARKKRDANAKTLKANEERAREQHKAAARKAAKSTKTAAGRVKGTSTDDSFGKVLQTNQVIPRLPPGAMLAAIDNIPITLPEPPTAVDSSQSATVSSTKVKTVAKVRRARADSKRDRTLAIPKALSPQPSPQSSPEPEDLGDIIANILYPDRQTLKRKASDQGADNTLRKKALYKNHGSSSSDPIVID